MAKIQVLIEGYAKPLGKGWRASSTTTLINDGGKRIIVDPGINRELLYKKMKDIKLTPDDIDVVYMTHTHPDHIYLAGIFEKAVGMDNDIIYEDDKETEYSGNIPGTDITVISTPGHDQFHSSLMVPTKEGNIVIAGDVFWWTETEKQDTSRKALLAKKDPFVKDEKALTKSRRKILRLADFIIPGHGKMFKVTK